MCPFCIVIKGDLLNLYVVFLAINDQIKKLESTDNLKLESLRRFDRGCYDAVMWLRNNQDKFSGKIYEPIMTQVFSNKL